MNQDCWVMRISSIIVHYCIRPVMHGSDQGLHLPLRNPLPFFSDIPDHILDDILAMYVYAYLLSQTWQYTRSSHPLYGNQVVLLSQYEIF